MRVRLYKIIVILFCFWHAGAVAVYAIPQESRDPVSSWFKNTILPKVANYVLITSQWQQWNLFAPDPLRRVTYYTIEQWNGQEWSLLQSLQPGTYSWWRHAAQFKVFERLLEEGNTWKVPLRQRYLTSFCQDFSLPQGTILRLVYHNYIIPREPLIRSVAWWNTFTPEWFSHPDISISC